MTAKKVLVIDDDENVLRSVVEYLDILGVEAITASDPSSCSRVSAPTSSIPKSTSTRNSATSTMSQRIAAFLLIDGAMSLPVRNESIIIAADQRKVMFLSVGIASMRTGKQIIPRTVIPTFSFAFKARSYSVNTQPHE